SVGRPRRCDPSDAYRTTAIGTASGNPRTIAAELFSSSDRGRGKTPDRRRDDGPSARECASPAGARRGRRAVLAIGRLLAPAARYRQPNPSPHSAEGVTTFVIPCFRG